MFDKLILMCLFCIFMSCCKSKEQELEAFKFKLIEAYELDLRSPNISQKIPDITIAEVYDIQKEFVSHLLVHEDIKGFMLNYIEHKQLSLADPVFSVIFEKHIQGSSGKLDLYGFHRAVCDNSLSFSVNKAITSKVKNIADVKDLVERCYISYGIYDLSLEDLKNFTRDDVIVVNAFTENIILEKEIALSEIKDGYFSIKSDTFKDGVYLFSIKFPNDPNVNVYNELLWLINQTIDQGYTIEKGMILTISGKDKVHTIEAGNYDVYLRSYGKTTVEIHPN